MSGSPFDNLKGMKQNVDSENTRSSMKPNVMPAPGQQSPSVNRLSGLGNASGVNVTQGPVTVIASNVSSPPVSATSALAQLSSKVPTGIPGFDQLIQGGFNRGSMNLISGITATGKSIFAIQFIMNGILQFNEVGIYLSFDEQRVNVFNNMKTFGWDLQKLEDEGKFNFVNYNPSQLQHMLNEGGGLLDSLMSKTNAKRIVIDPISSFLAMSSSEFDKREQLIALFKMLEKSGVTTLMTSGYSPIIGTESSTSSLSLHFTVDSITQLYYLQQGSGSERQRMLEIYKMRATNHVTKVVPFNIGTNGIQVGQ